MCVCVCSCREKKDEKIDSLEKDKNAELEEVRALEEGNQRLKVLENSLQVGLHSRVNPSMSYRTNSIINFLVWELGTCGIFGLKK